MPGQAFSAAAVCTFFPSSSPRECPFPQFSTRQERRILCYLWEKHPAIASRSVHHVHAVSSRTIPSPPSRCQAARSPAAATRFATASETQKALS